MSLLEILKLFGIPTIAVGVAVGAYKYLSSRIKAIRLGVQALLRDRLYQLYHFCKKNGSADEYERENFENLYKQYHNLGANGVMDDVRIKFLALPIIKDE